MTFYPSLLNPSKVEERLVILFLPFVRRRAEAGRFCLLVEVEPAVRKKCCPFLGELFHIVASAVFSSMVTVLLLLMFLSSAFMRVKHRL